MRAATVYGVYGASADGGASGDQHQLVGVYGETKALASTGAAGVYGMIGPSGMGVAGRPPNPTVLV